MLRGILTIGGWTAASRVLGLLRETLIAALDINEYCAIRIDRTLKFIQIMHAIAISRNNDISGS